MDQLRWRTAANFNEDIIRFCSCSCYTNQTHTSSHLSNTDVLVWLYHRIHQRTIARSLFLLFGVRNDVLIYSIYSAQLFQVYFSCIERLMWDACVGVPLPPTSAWRTADKKAMKSSAPKLHLHQQSEEGMFHSALPDEPEMLFELIFNGLSHHNSLNDGCEMSSGCQISVPVFGSK